MRINVIGAGYAGLVTGACLAHLGHPVRCVDVIPERVAAINQGVAPFFEPGLPELLKEGLDRGLLSASCDLMGPVPDGEVTIIAVGTPLRDGQIDLSYVEKAVEQVGYGWRSAPGYHVVVIKSTVVPGTTEGLVRDILERTSGRSAGEFGLTMNPEFLREGSAVDDFLQPDRIVIGQLDERSGRVLGEVYRSFDCPKIFTTLRNAEMIKYASNALLATLISFSNEIAAVCESSPGADIEVIMDGLHLDRRLSPVVDGMRIRPGILSYLRAGCGFGGSCLPKDVAALGAYAHQQGVGAHILNAVMAVNKERPQSLVVFAEQALGSLAGTHVAVLGLAFKPGTDDTRHSPALAVIDELTKKGALVRVYDPVVLASGRVQLDARITPCRTLEDALRDADAAIVVTAWSDLIHCNWSSLCLQMRRRVIIDGRNQLRNYPWPNQVTYIAIGQCFTTSGHARACALAATP